MTSATSQDTAEVVESKSPCVNVCHLENRVHNMICIGCLRTQEEIADWMTYTDLEKDKVLRRIKNVR